MNQLLAFFNLCQLAKNRFSPSVHSSDKVNFGVPSPNWSLPVFTMLTPKIFSHLLICVNLCQHAENQLIPFVHSGETVNFRVQRQDWPQPFLTKSNQKFFDQLKTFVNLYQHANNYSFLNLCWRSGWFKNPAIWLAETKNRANNINCYYRTNSVKIIDQK